MNVIEAENLSKRFGKKVVVNSLSMSVGRGEIYGFLGPNGSGKTTSLRMMCGLLTPDGGEGRTLGFDIRRESRKIKPLVGYMTQHFSFWNDLTVRENLEFTARVYRVKNVRAKVEETLVRLGLEGRSSQIVQTLSGGWKQRLALSACMIHNPKLLLLDEPTAGVDPKARKEFWNELDTLAATGISILVSTHYMDEAERCHKLCYMLNGDLLANGTKEEIIRAHGFAADTTFEEMFVKIIEANSANG